MSQNNYPQISARVKSVFIDTWTMVGLAIIVSFVFKEFGNVSDTYRMIAFVLVFVLYDPICVSFFGGTIGHYIMKIRVKRAGNESKNLLFPLAIIRFIIKVPLGIISLASIGSNDKSQAIHDLVVGSVVVYKGKVNSANKDSHIIDN